MAANEKLSRYLEAVEKVRAQRTQALDAATRGEIARELGMSDEDLAAARAEGERDLERGLGFLRHESWAEALVALNEADALLPDDLRVLSAIARAHAGKRDRQAAAAAARRCLEVDPKHEPSFRLLKSLEERPGWMYPAIGIALAVGISSAFIGFAVRRATPPSAPEALGPCGGQRYCDVDLDWRLAREAEGVTIALPRAQVHVTPEDAHLTVAGRLTHRDRTELEELIVEMVLLDQAGRELGRVTVPAKPSFSPPLRPGDSQAFLYSEKAPRGTRSLELRELSRKASPAPPSYDEGEAIELGFEPAAPGHFGLRAAYRTRKRQTLGSKVSSEAVAEIENTGKGVIRQLDVEWRAVDAAGRVVDKPRHETVVFNFLTPMDPGERRLVRLNLWVPAPVASERLVVVKIE